MEHRDFQKIKDLLLLRILSTTLYIYGTFSNHTAHATNNNIPDLISSGTGSDLPVPINAKYSSYIPHNFTYKSYPFFKLLELEHNQIHIFIL